MSMCIRHIQSIFISLAIICLAVLAYPQIAFANGEITELGSTAQVHTDGSLHVVEYRSYEGMDDRNILAWSISGLPSMSEVDVLSMRMAIYGEDGAPTQELSSITKLDFQNNWRDVLKDLNGSLDPDNLEGIMLPTDEPWWSFDERTSTVYLYTDDALDFLLEYEWQALDAIMVFDDVAELYWDYISSSNEIEIASAIVQIQLPVPEGITVIPNETVQSWGHGPEGVIDTQIDGTITYETSDVAPGRYAQAHLIFPARWMSNISKKLDLSYTGTRRDTAVNEESSWSDTYTAKTSNSLILRMAACGLSFLALAIGAAIFMIWGKPLRREDTVEKNLNVAIPSKIGCAEAGRFARWGHVSSKDIVSTLVSLNVKGALSTKFLYKNDGTLEDIEFRLSPKAKDDPKSILEHNVLSFLFDDVSGGYLKTTSTAIKSYLETHKTEGKARIKAWQEALTKIVDQDGLFDARARKAKKMLLSLAAAMAIIFLLTIRLLGWWSCAMLLSAICLLLMASYCMRYSQKGIALSEEVDEIPHRLLDPNITESELNALVPYAYATLSEKKFAQLFKQIENSGKLDARSDDVCANWFEKKPNAYGKPMPSAADKACLMIEECLQD